MGVGSSGWSPQIRATSRLKPKSVRFRTLRPICLTISLTIVQAPIPFLCCHQNWFSMLGFNALRHQQGGNIHTVCALTGFRSQTLCKLTRSPDSALNLSIHPFVGFWTSRTNSPMARRVTSIEGWLLAARSAPFDDTYCISAKKMWAPVCSRRPPIF